MQTFGSLQAPSSPALALPGETIFGLVVVFPTLCLNAFRRSGA